VKSNKKIGKIRATFSARSRREMRGLTRAGHERRNAFSVDWGGVLVESSFSKESKAEEEKIGEGEKGGEVLEGEYSFVREAPPKPLGRGGGRSTGLAKKNFTAELRQTRQGGKRQKKRTILHF